MKKIYNNKKVLIFGSTGFVGSWISIALKYLGANVLGISLRMNNQGYLSNTKEFNSNIQNIYCDINNLSKIKNKIKSFRPEIVIHLASQPIVSEGYDRPLKTFDTNIMGTINILECIKEIKTIKKIIIFTSDKVYKNDYSILKENSSLGGQDPYSASKSCQDMISQSYAYSFLKNKITILRSGNIIGGGDWGKNRLIPDIVQSIKQNKKVKIRSLNSTRPWIHILDVINGFLLIINQKKISSLYEIYNLASKNKRVITVGKILKIVKKNKYIKKLQIDKIKNQIKEKKYLQLSSDKITKKLGWKPKIKIDEMINLSFEIYFSKKNILYRNVENQIIKFLKKQKY